MKVYLAGQITGLTYDQANGWREDVTKVLDSVGIDVLNPLRNKGFLREYGVLNGNYYRASPLSSAKGIVTRDRNDVANCDIVLMNLKNMDRVSIGCMVEVGWADMLRKPIVMVLDEKSPYEHEFIKEISGYIVNELDEALEIVKAILGVKPPTPAYVGPGEILASHKYSGLVGTDTEVPVDKYDC